MQVTQNTQGGLNGNVLFIATLWMAICVALLCAVMPMGLPSSKATGSAFSPATTSVVLKSRSIVTPEIVKRAPLPGSGKAAPVIAAYLLLALALSGASRRIPLSSGGPARAPSVLHPVFQRRKGARAPPVRLS